jgi:hypothetical protein
MITNQPYSSVFIEEGGWTRYKQTLRANSENLANKYSKKLETLIDSARARTVRPSIWCSTHPISCEDIDFTDILQPFPGNMMFPTGTLDSNSKLGI